MEPRFRVGCAERAPDPAQRDRARRVRPRRLRRAAVAARPGDGRRARRRARRARGGDGRPARRPGRRSDLHRRGGRDHLHRARRPAVACGRALATHPALVGLCHDLIGPNVNLYWDQAVYKKPEKPRRFPWHQDNGYVFVEPQQYLTCWIALTDTTLDNGCPWILPGAHRAGTLLHHWVDPIGWECFADNPEGAVATELPAGGAVVFSSLTPHLTGPNLTDAVRKACIVQYAPVGVRRLEGDWQHGDRPQDA
ncbi:MAG TPA: phytanoyl-CoA dioxygenase family protein, partial [Acidimicrobiia bacterium]|nr:phytanoyl-CoA dioxygenase family protein [Acidimicrobiia bacterium]